MSLDEAKRGKPVRIALVGPVYPYRGGIAHYTTMLWRALRERGHDVLLVSFRRQYPQRLFPGRGDRDPSEKPLRVEEARYWIDSLNPLTWLVTGCRIGRTRPDVVVLQWWTTFWAPAWLVLGGVLRLLTRRPLAFICHNVLPHEARPWDAWLARLVLGLGTRHIVQSKMEEYKLRSLLPKAHVTIVPHPVYDMFAGERVPQAEARAQLGLPLEAPILLFFGIVREYKGLHDVLAALPQVRAQLPDALLIVAGEFWDDKQPYLERIAQLGLDGAVYIEDYYIPNERVALYFSAADALVAPYRRATGSGVVQMGRGFRVPVITTGVCEGAAEAIASERAGRVTSPGDPAALADAILSILTGGPALDREQAIADDCFSWQRLVDLIAALGEETA